MPEFVVVRRGVDRRQVEEWGKKLTSLIEQERRRADQAERALYRTQLEARGTPSFTHLGAHAAGIIQEAGQSAEVFRVQTEQEARSLLEEAREATEALWQEAERERLAVEGETRRLEGLRRRNHQQLGQMYGH